MKLSMWMVADWLQKYNPVIKIETGEPVLRGVRILSQDTRIESQNVYLASAGEFFGDEREKVICVQGHDLLLLDTEDMESVLNDIFDAFDYYNRWFDGLENAIRDGCELQYLVDESDDIFENPILIYNASHIVSAYSREAGDKLALTDQEWQVITTTHSNSLEMLQMLNEHIKNSRFSHQVQRLNFPFLDVTSLQRMLFQDNTTSGRIIILEYEGLLSKGKLQLMDSFGYLVEQWMYRNRESALMQAECGIFLDLLHQNNVSAATLHHKLDLAGWKKEHDKLLLKLEIPSEYQEITYPLLSRLEHMFPECYVFPDRGAIYVLANISFSGEDKIFQDICWLQKQSVFYCGVSYPFHDLMALRTADEQCSLALAFAAGERGGLYFCKDYALSYIKNALRTHLNLSAVHPALKLLQDNDRVNHDELYATLYQYLTHNCNMAQTARLLNLHRNSLLYRMNKIKDLTGVDLEEDDTRQYLYLSYLLEDA